MPPPIPDYELLSLIGRGSYGDVWLGRGATGLFRAIKVVWRDKFEDPEPYEREFRGLSDFMRRTQGETHQMALLHVGRDDQAGFFYYVMELADDAVTGNEIDPECYAPLTLKVRRDQSDHVYANEVLAIGIELAAGLAELHDTGLVHRDIKPSNIIIVNGRPKLADIGQVSATHDPQSIVGTEGFIPPEGPGAPTADIFSLGKVLYELAMGEDRQNFPSLPTNLSEREDRSELLELNEIIVKACAPLAQERHANALTLLDELKLLQAGKSVRRLRFAERGLARARKWILAAVAVAAVAGIGAAIERNRANVEAAGRAAAEAELAELTRRTLYDASLASAQRALETENYGVAREALERAIPLPGDPDLRGFEWHALWREAQGDPAEIIRESGDTVTRLEPSPDGRWMAVDNTKPSIDLHDANTGAFVRSIEGIHRIAGFSADGSRLIGTTPDYEIETWAIEDGSSDAVPNKTGINRPLQVHPDLPHLLYFEDSPDDSPHVIGVWNYETGEIERSWPIVNLQDNDRWVFHQASASLKLDVVMLAMTARFGSGDTIQQKVRLIDMSSGRVIAERHRERYNNPIALSPDGQRFVLHDDQLVLGSFPNLEAGLRQTNYSSVGQHLDFDDNGELVLAPAFGNKVVEISLEPGTPAIEFRGSKSQINFTSYDASGQFIWSADRNGEIRRWPRERSRRSPSMIEFDPSKTTPVFQLGLSPDSQIFVARSETGILRAWDFPQLTVRWSHPGIRSMVELGNQTCLVLSREGELLELDTTTGEIIRGITIDSQETEIRTASASPSGNHLLVELVDDRLVWWDTINETSISEINRSLLGLEHHQLADYALTDDGMVVSVDTLPRVMVWNVTSGEIIHEQQDLTRPNRIQLSPSQKLISISGGNEPARIVALPYFEPVQVFPGSRTNGVDLTFHPAEPVVATQVLRGSVTLIDFLTNQHRSQLNFRAEPDDSQSGQVANIVFSADAKVMLVSDLTGRIRIWRRE